MIGFFFPIYQRKSKKVSDGDVKTFSDFFDGHIFLEKPNGSVGWRFRKK
jgi:hypothetical protein